MVTDGNTKLCCHGSVLVLFQSTTANKIDSEHARDYMKLFPACKVEILQVTVNKIDLLSSFRVISDHFLLKVQKIAKRVPWFLVSFLWVLIKGR